jgi:hypothetical protein
MWQLTRSLRRALAMLPYWFSAMTVQAVGKAALRMVDEVRHQFRTIPGLMEGSARPNYQRCIGICTQASLREMVAPGALVMLSPIIVGVLFGTHSLAGLLAGALVSGVQARVACMPCAMCPTPQVAADTSFTHRWQSQRPTPAAPGTTPRSTSKQVRAWPWLCTAGAVCR